MSPSGAASFDGDAAQQPELLDRSARMRLLAAFVGYLAVSVVHVALLAVGQADAARVTKTLLMPALAVGVLIGSTGAVVVRRRVLASLLVAIALSWVGDVAWLFFVGHETLGMLGSFLLAHLVYIALFAGQSLRLGRPRPWTLSLAIWWIGLLLALWPALAELRVPVMIYGAVLALMVVSATATRSTMITLGALLFLCSDSVLAIYLFVAGDQRALDPIIMATYCAAQGMIAIGVLTHGYSARSAAGAGNGNA